MNIFGNLGRFWEITLVASSMKSSHQTPQIRHFLADDVSKTAVSRSLSCSSIPAVPRMSEHMPSNGSAAGMNHGPSSRIVLEITYAHARPRGSTST